MFRFLCKGPQQGVTSGNSGKVVHCAVEWKAVLTFRFCHVAYFKGRVEIFYSVSSTHTGWYWGRISPLSEQILTCAWELNTPLLWLNIRPHCVSLEKKNGSPPRLTSVTRAAFWSQGLLWHLLPTCKEQNDPHPQISGVALLHDCRWNPWMASWAYSVLLLSFVFITLDTKGQWHMLRFSTKEGVPFDSRVFNHLRPHTSSGLSSSA